VAQAQVSLEIWHNLGLQNLIAMVGLTILVKCKIIKLQPFHANAVRSY
jgi:hypothetical protein